MPKSWINFGPAKQRVKRKFREAGSPLQKAARRLRAKMASGIRQSNSSSAAGSPPNTRGMRRSLKKAMRYGVENEGLTAVIGPSAEVSGITGYYHEFGARKKIQGRRRQYDIGKTGPLDYRYGYETPLGKIRQRIPGGEGVAFGRIRTHRQLLRAKKYDELLWPEADSKVRYTQYPRRPFRQRALDSLAQTVRDSIKTTNLTA